MPFSFTERLSTDDADTLQRLDSAGLSAESPNMLVHVHRTRSLVVQLMHFTFTTLTVVDMELINNLTSMWPYTIQYISCKSCKNFPGLGPITPCNKLDT